MGNLICIEDDAGKYVEEDSIPESERMEAYLWANLTCLAEKIDSPEEKAKMTAASNGSLLSLQDFVAGPAYALTGMVTDSDGQSTPFVVFRGDTDENAKEDAQRMIVLDCPTTRLITSSGALVGEAVADFVGQYEALRDLGLVRWALNSAKMSNKGLTIAGHGIGGAIANLLAVELLVDYGNEFPVRLRTFGAPRIFDVGTAKSIRSLEAYNKMSFTRYVNDGNICLKFK